MYPAFEKYWLAAPTNTSSTKNEIKYARLANKMQNLGLIDEYHLIVNPVVLEGGKLLFKDVKERHKLKLIKAETFKSGKVVLHYSKASYN